MTPRPLEQKLKNLQKISWFLIIFCIVLTLFESYFTLGGTLGAPPDVKNQKSGFYFLNIQPSFWPFQFFGLMVSAFIIQVVQAITCFKRYIFIKLSQIE